MTSYLIRLSVGLLLSSVLPAKAVEYYVTPVLPNPKCPADQPCLELDEYALNSSLYFSDRDSVTLHFLDGDHSLTKELNFTNIEKLLWLGNLNETSCVCIQIQCGAAITFNAVSELVMNKLSIEATLNDCFELHLETSSFYLEEVVITSINTTILSGGFILITNCTFNCSLLSVWIIGSSDDYCETNIKNSRLIDSPDSYSFLYSEFCDDCRMNLMLDNVTTNRSKLNLSQEVPNLETGDLHLYTTIYTPHKVNITDSSFNRSPSVGILFYVSIPQHQVNSTYKGEIIISRTNFSENRLGGMMVWFQKLSDIQTSGTPPKLSIEDCTFSYNSMASVSVSTEYPASALTVIGDPILIDISISRSSFLGNIDTRSIPIAVLISFQTVKISNSNFSANTGTALKAYNSHVFISEEVNFMSNSAYEGGGMVLVNSYLHLSKNANVRFYNNTAQHVGGGILVKQETVNIGPADFSQPRCFYQIDNESENVSVNMIDNSAKHGGDHIYGASLKSQCRVNNSDDADNSYKVWKNVFHFKGSSHLSPVSSDSTRVCQCDAGPEMPNCTQLYKIFNTTLRFPGERFSISAALVGDDFGTTSGAIYTQFISPNPSNFSISELQTSQTVNKSCNQIQFTVHSNKTGRWETLMLTPHFNTPPFKHSTMEEMQTNVDEYMQYGYIPPDLLQTPIYIKVYLLPCPLGFILLNGVCQCDTVLVENNIECAIKNRQGLVYRSGSVWINASYDDNGTSNGVILNMYCPHQYCREEKLAIDLEEPNMQCAFNHAGTLCGACMQGYSLTVGSQRCLMCENNSGVALLLFFILAGFVLVLFVKFFDLTVTYGTISGLIFYANIIWVNQSILFPEKQSLAVQILKVFIAWINLDFGIETCFFVGLDAYWKTWMQFLFPFYIWTIAGVIIILSRYSAVATRLFGNNSVPVLATLILLSYAKLLRTIINVVELTFLEYPDGHRLIVWALDGNVPYIVSKHGPLFFAGIAALLFLWLPYTMALFLVPWLRAKSNWKCLRWINKLKPFFDANFGPLKDRQHYWIGLLLLVRGFLFIIMLLSATSKVSQSVNLLTIVFTVTLLLVHPEPYKKWYLTLLEKSFFLNVIAFCNGVFYVERVGGSKTAVANISLGFAVVQFVVIFLVHAYATMRRLKMCTRYIYRPRQDNHTHTHVLQTERPHTTIVAPSGPGEDRYNLLRESLLESEDEAD